MKLIKLACTTFFLTGFSCLALATTDTQAANSSDSPQQTTTVQKTKKVKATDTPTQEVGSSAKTAAITLMTIVMPTVSSQITSGSDTHKNKRVLAAKNDAANYLASDGQLKGAYLEKALQTIRTNQPSTRNVSDIELAKAILAY